MRATLCILTLAISAMVIAGPAETHHDHLCATHQPNPAITCRRH